MRTIIVAFFLYSIISALTQVCLSYVVAESGDSKILNVGGILKCDWIECPKGTKRCAVKKNTRENDLSQIDREVTCYGGNNKVLMTQKKTENNPDSGASVSSYLEGSVNSGGNIFTGPIHSSWDFSFWNPFHFW